MCMIRTVDITSWRLGDALNLPFEDESFDAITMAYGLRNVASVPLALKEIHKVLKQGVSSKTEVEVT